MKFALIVGIVLLAAACLVPRAGAQNPDTMMPEQSEAKGKQILQDLMNGLGLTVQVFSHRLASRGQIESLR